MRPHKKTVFSLVIVAFVLLTASSLYAQAKPVLLFSDLTWGPKTGWEGSTTKGAAVTIWGKNLSSANGTNKITACGVDILSSDSAYVAEWGVTGTANHIARGLERITFWLKNTMTDGSGTIAVTVGGLTSNTLPLTIATGKIYFISVSDGNNSYNGLYSTRSGHSGSDGPFKDIFQFNPSNNPSGDGQYICYVRGGTYSATEADPSGAFVALRGPYGGPMKQKALIAYPGEVPTIDTTNAGYGIIWNADYDPYGMNSYFTYSKLYGVGGWSAIDNFGNYNRTIGCHFKDYLSEIWSGVVWVEDSKYTSIYGNYFDHNGYDSYKHNIYIKTQPSISNVDYSTLYTNIGWNEISNPVAGADNRGGAIFISKSTDVSIEPYNTQYVYIHDNYFHDGNMEFIYTGDNTTLYDIYIYNNIFTGGTAGSGSIFLAWDTDSAYIYNNTFYNTISPMVLVVGATHAILKNNIYYANIGQTSFDIDTSEGGTITSDHDLFYGYNTSIPSGDGITVTNAKIGNPLLVNPATGDFHLQPTSSAIDAGTASVSSTVTQDYDGNSRPQWSGYDIGAYEYLKPYRRSIADFDGDRKTDVAIYRVSTGAWWIVPSSGTGAYGVGWGGTGFTPVPGDYDGDGKTDVAIYQASTGAWWIVPSSGTGAYGVGWGGAGFTPVPGDYDGDGKTDIAIYQAGTGAWWIKPSSTGTAYGVGWGGAGFTPVPGDYDGDGRTDVAIFQVSTGAWGIKPSSTGTPYGGIWGGDASDIPVPGDYDGDGKTDVAIYRRGDGVWYIIPSSSPSAPYGVGWGGGASDKPVPGDYDGDGKTDVAIYRRGNGVWYIIPSSSPSAPYGVGWGGDNTDVPVSLNVSIQGM